MKNNSWFDACFTAKSILHDSASSDEKTAREMPEEAPMLDYLNEMPLDFGIELTNGTTLVFKTVGAVCEFFYMQGVLSQLPCDFEGEDEDEDED